MKSLFFAVFLITTLANAVCVEIKNEGDFLSAIKTALTEKDVDKLTALQYAMGMSDADKALAAKSQKALLLTQGEIMAIAAEPLPSGFRTSYIYKGRRYEPTCAPAGIVKVNYKQSNGATSSLEFPYGVVDGVYYLAGTKSTDLNWTGPPDIQIGFMVMGTGQDKVTIKVKYNASGVNEEETFHSPSSIFFGQYFSEINVSSDDPSTDVTLTVRENGKVIFTSEPLKGKGEVKYVKNDG